MHALWHTCAGSSSSHLRCLSPATFIRITCGLDRNQIGRRNDHDSGDVRRKLTSKMPEPCGLCGKPASLKCGKCTSISYCSKEHQRQQWHLHRQICKQITADRDGNGSDRHVLTGFSMSNGPEVQLETMTGPMSVPKPADWRKGLSKSAAAEWLVDSYRMRVDDDFAWGGGMCIAGKQHGLYHLQCTPKLMATDFFIFAKLAVQHGCAIALRALQKMLLIHHSLKPKY